MRLRPTTANDKPASSPARADGGRAHTRSGVALALQRATGNRATTRRLARWIKDPDAANKGAVVPDVVAEAYARFNASTNE